MLWGSMKNIRMQDKSIVENGEKDSSVWYIMTSPNPKAIEEYLLEENIRRQERGEYPFQYFVPYRFLKRRIAGAGPDEEPEDIPYFNPKNREDVASNNALRAALKRYIFIKAGGRELENLLLDKTHQDFCKSLWYYRDKSRNKVTVRHSVMEQFINACCDKRLQFEVWPALDSIEQNDEVVLNTTQFKGYKAKVLEIRHDSRNGYQLTVGFHLFHGAMLLKLPNLRPQDVLYERKDTERAVRETNRYKFIEDIQRKLFAIMSRRLKNSPSEKSKKKDATTLELLYTYRYRLFESDAMRRKFCALMLLCATLRGDIFGKSELTEKVKRELSAINFQPEGKMSTDVRAFLQSVLYIATHEPMYKEEALVYFRSHAKPSATHKQWMKFLIATDFPCPHKH